MLLHVHFGRSDEIPDLEFTSDYLRPKTNVFVTHADYGYLKQQVTVPILSTQPVLQPQCEKVTLPLDCSYLIQKENIINTRSLQTGCELNRAISSAMQRQKLANPVA